MRLTNYLLPTLKESPADAEIASHKLMLRAGMIRKLAAGIYSYLPLGLRSIRKVEQIVRQEMDKAGAMELLMPMTVPAELWQESGRWEQYGKELLRLRDRKDTEFCLSPTHEEVITDIVRGTVRSYRQLPMSLYQIQGKFRDEIRPRFGLMRGREFIMKDAYSFDLDDASADISYDKMYRAYQNIFKRCGLNFRAVEADTGSIGGSSSHEFMVLADSGEDAIVSCDSCDYAANVEKAQLRLNNQQPPQAVGEVTEVATPGRKTIAEVANFLELPQSRLIKTLLVQTDTGEQLAVLLRGDRELNEIKLCRFLGCVEIEMVGEKTVVELTGAPSGFAGPVGLTCRVIADHEVRNMVDCVVGANVVDMHCVGVCPGRDFEVADYVDLRQAEAGDGCPRCEGLLQSWRGIEVGHVFKLGTKYSQALGATVLNREGKDVPLVMGCYGIGIGRTVAAAIEQNHDDNGVIFPMAIAPFQVMITLLNAKDEQVVSVGNELYNSLLASGIEAVLDDRADRPGSKFKDADLIGVPIRVTVGGRALKEGAFEVQVRGGGERQMMPVAETATWLVEEVQRQLAG